MSISLPFLKGGATKPSVIEAVTTVLSRTAPKVALAPLCLKHDLQQIRSISSNALLASSLTSDEIASTNLFHSTLTHTSEAFIKNINVEYQNLVICLVRSIVSDPELCALRYRDRIDSLTSFNLNQEIAHVRKCMEHTVQCAIQEAKVHKSESITLVLKTVTRHEKINNLLQEIAQEKCAAAGIQLTVAHTAQVHNRLIMFPEQFRVLLANDVPASDHLDGVVLGLAGGNGITHQYLLGTQAKGFMGNGSSENPLSTLVAASEAMKHLGLHEESATTLKVLKNAISKESHRTKDLGGSMDAMSFAKVCVA